MYILFAGYPNGDMEVYGPFPTIESAEQYAMSFKDVECPPQRWYIKEIIVPLSVVKTIILIWR